jgi:hypothetical protein
MPHDDSYLSKFSHLSPYHAIHSAPASRVGHKEALLRAPLRSSIQCFQPIQRTGLQTESSPSYEHHHNKAPGCGRWQDQEGTEAGHLQAHRSGEKHELVWEEPTMWRPRELSGLQLVCQEGYGGHGEGCVATLMEGGLFSRAGWHLGTVLEVRQSSLLVLMKDKFFD